MARKLAKLSCTCDNWRAIRRRLTGTCADCGTQFRAHNSWQRRCHRCFLALKERNKVAARQDAHDATRDSAFDAARDSADDAARDSADDAARDSAYDAGWDGGYRSGRLSALTEDLLHDLIQLSHPDRHSGRVDLATRVTRQLLELRENTRRPA